MDVDTLLHKFNLTFTDTQINVVTQVEVTKVAAKITLTKLSLNLHTFENKIYACFVKMSE